MGHPYRDHVENHAGVGPGEARRAHADQVPAVSWGGGRRGLWVCPRRLGGGAGRGRGYVAAVPHRTRVWEERPVLHVPPWQGRGRRPPRERLGVGAPEARTGGEVAAALPAAAWTPQTIQEGRPGPMGAECARLRLVAVRDALPGPDVGLVLRRHLETGELKTYRCNAPVDLPLETLVRLRGRRWPLDTGFEDRQPWLGLGDDAIRRGTGGHPHRTWVILAHFCVGRMSRRFKKSPSGDVAPGGDGLGHGLTQTRVRRAVRAGHSGLSTTQESCGVSLTSQASHGTPYPTGVNPRCSTRGSLSFDNRGPHKCSAQPLTLL
jgi:hypothetical protein